MSNEPKRRIDQCKFSLVTLGDMARMQIIHCCKKDPTLRTITEQDCQSCELYKSMYIQYPIQVSDIRNDDPTAQDGLRQYAAGQIVMVKPCQDEYKGQYMPGILLGELPWSVSSQYDEDTHVLRNRIVKNPAIWVPAMGRIVYGAECWWAKMTDLRELDKATTIDQDVAWLTNYVSSYGLHANENNEKEGTIHEE